MLPISVPNNFLQVLDKNFEPGFYSLNGPIEIKNLIISKDVILEIKKEKIKNIDESFDILQNESAIIFNNSKIINEIKIYGELYILEESFPNGF
jgi:hypothetical protein